MLRFSQISPGFSQVRFFLRNFSAECGEVADSSFAGEARIISIFDGPASFN